MRRQIRFWAIALLLLAALAAQGQEITPKGKKLTLLLDSMDVEHLWLAQQYVHWRTGKPMDKPVTDEKPHTHCSAFVAAVGAKLDVYILRPPQHKAAYLANAQSEWLQSKEGQGRGWKPIATMQAAQEEANQGALVVAVYQESDPKKHGHIAIVRPDAKSKEAIQQEGPQVTQAGMENFTSASLKEGFRHHKGAWKDHAIQFFSHKIDWDQVKTEGRKNKKDNNDP